MTDYIEILRKAGKMRALMTLHDQASDVDVYMKCSSADIGKQLELRMRARFGSMAIVSAALYFLGEADAAAELESFIESSHRMCGSCESDSDISHFIDMSREFIKRHTVRIKDH